MEEKYIDICDTKRNYEKSLERFRSLSSVSDHNKELVMRFLRDAALGKTIIGRAKKKIGYSRLMIYIRHMVILSEFLKKNLDSVTQDDIELFIEALETDQVEGSKTLVQRNGTVARQKATFSPRYKTDIKFSVRKFYKWLWGESRFYPKIVEWIDTSLPRNEIPALSELEVEKVIDRSRTVLQRALVQVLFDGGFRIGELLNVRLRHVRVKAFDVAGERRRHTLAFKWQGLLDSGRYASVTELARALDLDRSYVGRIIRLTLLAPDTVEAILRGEEPSGLSLDRLVTGVPMEWGEQRAAFGGSCAEVGDSGSRRQVAVAGRRCQGVPSRRRRDDIVQDGGGGL